MMFFLELRVEKSQEAAINASHLKSYRDTHCILYSAQWLDRTLRRCVTGLIHNVMFDCEKVKKAWRGHFIPTLRPFTALLKTLFLLAAILAIHPKTGSSVHLCDCLCFSILYSLFLPLRLL